MNRASILKLKTAVCILFLAILAACGQASPAMPTLTLTVAPTASSTSTITPIPTDTNTPEPTPTRKVKQFEICSAKDWKKCYIPIEELGVNGDYYRWVSESWHPNLPTPDSSGESKRYWIIWDGTGGAQYMINHKVTDEKPFAAGFTYGYTKCGVTWGGVSHEMTCAVVPVAIAVPDREGESIIVIGLFVQAYDATDAQVTGDLKQVERMDTLMLTGFRFDSDTGKVTLAGNDTIDFLGETIRNYPDLYERFGKFKETLDPTFISEPGVVLDIPAVYKG